MKTRLWTGDDVEAFCDKRGDGPGLAMYRSDWDAIVTEPGWMQVPVDDHLVHRGDGVFETLLCEEEAVYNLTAHLDRLQRSAAFIGMDVPLNRERLTEVILDTFRTAGKPRSLARLLVGRGPGGFSVDPSEPEVASLYMIVYPAPPPFMERVPGGAKAVLSRIPPKPGGLATVKTCNYLPNALMKAEANAKGAHFAVGVDGDGYLTESFTENLAAVDDQGDLILLPPTAHLAGTTLDRVAALALEHGMSLRSRALRPQDLFEMREVWLVGTTAYVSQMASLDGSPLPTGPLAGTLSEALRRDIAGNAGMRTRVF